MRRAHFGIAALVLLGIGCGKKGPPLPPLVRVPGAPTELTAHRQGGKVTLRFVIPSHNIDGASPADVGRVEIYALTGVSTPSADQVVRRGTRVGSVVVNPPAQPNETEAQREQREAKNPKDGIDQGNPGVVVDTLPSTLDADSVRAYAAIAFSPRGRRGTPSAPVTVPLVPAPPAPEPPTITYDATTLRFAWPASDGAPAVQLYEATKDNTRLTTNAITDGRFEVPGVEFGVEKCFVTRNVAAIAGAVIESEPSSPACVTPRDTFPPDAPSGLNAVPETGAISLIWNPVDAPDLAGYLVLRQVAPQTTPTIVTDAPLADTTYRDTVPSGSRVTYTIVAVDKSGNRSEPSAPIEETVR